ncbi:MAG: hypothetical protein AAFR83_17585, partial [Cyanobacteria bacterium J06629_18]
GLIFVRLFKRKLDFIFLRITNYTYWSIGAGIRANIPFCKTNGIVPRNERPEVLQKGILARIPAPIKREGVRE